MKIALVAPTYLPARRANTIQVMKMAQAFTILGHDIQVWVPKDSTVDESSPSWAELAHHYGLQHEFAVTWLTVKPFFRRYDYGFKAARQARRWDADLVYTRLPQAAALASSLGMPTVFEVHDMPRGWIGPRLSRRFLRGRGARRMVVISRALRDDILRNFRVPNPSQFILIAPDGVDLPRYENLPSPVDARRELIALDKDVKPLPPDQFTVGYTGHLYEGRGVNLILEIAGRLPEITFMVVGGEPDDVDRVRIEVAEQNLQNVILTGFVPNSVLPLYQAACEVLLMPYQQKIAASSGGDIASYLSPMKLFEYLAVGRGILSSDLPVIREVLDTSNAVLLPSDEADAWVTALLSLKVDTDRLRTLANQARNDAKIYSWEMRAQRILDGLS